MEAVSPVDNSSARQRGAVIHIEGMSVRDSVLSVMPHRDPRNLGWLLQGLAMTTDPLAGSSSETIREL